MQQIEQKKVLTIRIQLRAQRDLRLKLIGMIERDRGLGIAGPEETPNLLISDDLKVLSTKRNGMRRVLLIQDTSKATPAVEGEIQLMTREEVLSMVKRLVQ
ncbi:MAG: hypothetical protein K9M11_02000 [Candidatus Pacebacteria bacterium]|nr:hypothetical protein [Candidatus Paceibacterota bacterium]